MEDEMRHTDKLWHERGQSFPSGSSQERFNRPHVTSDRSGVVVDQVEFSGQIRRHLNPSALLHMVGVGRGGQMSDHFAGELQGFPVAENRFGGLRSVRMFPAHS